MKVQYPAYESDHAWWAGMVDNFAKIPKDEENSDYFGGRDGSSNPELVVDIE